MERAVEKIKAVIHEAATLSERDVFAAMGYMPRVAEGSVVMTQAEIDAMKAAASNEGVEAAKSESLSRVVALGELCELSGMLDMLPGLIKNGVSVDDAKRAILAEKAKRSGTDVRSTISGHAGAINPLIVDAEKRAGKVH